MFYWFHMAMVEPADSLYAGISVFSWVGVVSGVLAGLSDLPGLFFSFSQSQDLSLSAWTLHVILKGGFSTVTARLLTQRLSIWKSESNGGFQW